MFEQSGVVDQPPLYINEVEKAIGVQFFAEPNMAELARTDPAALGDEVIQTYAGVYVAGLHMLADARRRFGVSAEQLSQLTSAQWRELREVHAERRAEIIEYLTAVAPIIDEPHGAISALMLRTELGLGRVLFDDIVAELNSVFMTYKRSPNSQHGLLHFSASEASRVRLYAKLFDFSGPAERLTGDLMAELHTSRSGLNAAAEATGAAITGKRSSETGVYGLFVGPDGVAALRAYFAAMEKTAADYSVTEIAAAANVTNDVVRAQAAWHGYGNLYYRKRYLNDEDHMITTDCLPAKEAEVLLYELSIIVPDEYLTIQEYADLRGLDDSNVRRTVLKHNLPQHEYNIRERLIRYLDGATMHRLDQLIKPFERAPEGWKTRQQIMELVDASDSHVLSFMTDEFEDDVRTMKPHEGEGPAVPHYSPAFVAHVQRSVKPKGVAKGRTSLEDLEERTGVTRTGLIMFLRRQGVGCRQVRVEGGFVHNTYDDEELAVALKKMPKRWVPIYGISAIDLATFHGTTKNNLRQKLRRVKGKLPSGKFTMGEYYTEAGGVGAYYLKEELRAVGIAIPATPAFPAGERPYGNYGPARGVGPMILHKVIEPAAAEPEEVELPAEESSELVEDRAEESQGQEPEEDLAVETTGTETQVVPPPDPRAYRPGSTLRPPKPRVGSIFGTMLPPGTVRVRSALIETNKITGRAPSHRPEVPGSWAPAAVSNVQVNYISVRERLTRSQIAERLGVEESVVDAAIARVDPGNHRPEQVEVEGETAEVYGGPLLVAIRQQLVGIPLGYLQPLFGLKDHELERARRYLRHHGHNVFGDDYYSPGAIDFMAKNIEAIRGTAAIVEDG